MAEDSQYVNEAKDVLFTLERGQANTLSPYLFQEALVALGAGDPQICGPLKRCLKSPDDINVRLRVLEMIAKTGQGWASVYGAQFADEIVLSLADSNLECAANASLAIQYWEPEESVATALLAWGKRHTHGIYEVHAIEAVHLPTVQKMIAELPAQEGKLKERRELPNSHPSLENNIRLWGKFKGTMMSVFNRG